MLRVLGVVLGVILFLGSCKTPWFPSASDQEGRENRHSPPPESVTFKRPNSKGLRFKYIPKRGSDLAREDLLRLMEATDTAYQAFKLEKPYPLTKILSDDFFEYGEVARAVIMESGREGIYINREWLMSGHPIEGTILHEYAHIMAWRQYGTDIKPHGVQFRYVCMSATDVTNCTEYFSRRQIRF